MRDQDRMRPKSEPADKKDPANAEQPPPAGPHAKPELTNPDATPGSGMLPADNAEDDANAGPSG